VPPYTIGNVTPEQAFDAVGSRESVTDGPATVLFAGTERDVLIVYA
jgi:hypothetical protein